MTPLAVIQKDPDLKNLEPEFAAKVQNLLAGCYQRGVVMIPTCGVRTLDEQAKLYRQSRSSATIAAEADKLRKQGAPFLAERLLAVGPQKGALGVHVTKALPGLSWHNWGLAVDCAWELNGKISWSLTDLYKGQNGYKMYGALADDYGLFSGGANWGWDWPHVQSGSGSSPKTFYSMAEIDQRMRKRYGG